jgi:pyridoxine kinase
MTTRQGDIIAISSHVARGSVGLRAMSFALERLGFAVWAVPTILLPYHPGHGPAERIVPDDAAFARLVAALSDRRLGGVAAIVSGYVASPAQAEAIAGLVAAVKAARADALYVCDPVIGDAGQLYVSEAIAAAMRDRLLPLADLATPNAFECAWLAGRVAGGAGDWASLAAAARSLAPPRIVVTSAPALMRGHVANLLVERPEALMAEHRLVESRTKGTGDLLAALLTARLVEGRDPAKALELATASVLALVALTARLGGKELALAAGQDALAQPHARVSLRRLP